MKKICCVICLIVIIFFSCFLYILEVTNKKNINKDGVIFAVTIDGQEATSFPERGEYTVDISCTNGRGKWLSSDWKFIIEDITGKVSCNISFVSGVETLLDQTINLSTQRCLEYATDAQCASSDKYVDYRYSFSKANNWIWFNNELWRIIGAVNGKIQEETENRKLVKIIREDSIGYLTYNANIYDDTGRVTYVKWGDNTLYRLLNNYYYNNNLQDVSEVYETSKSYKKYYLCSSYAQKDIKLIGENTYTLVRNICDYRNIGIQADSYYGKMVVNSSWNVGINEHSCGSAIGCGEEYEDDSKIQGYVGVANKSDYDFGGGLSNGEGIHINMEVVQSTENVSDDIRPVVHLDPSVYVVSGDGTELNPYQIAM